MVKVDLITGFLGSGKTTFIRKYAKYLMDEGNNIGILENDYGAVNVDMMLLQDLMGDNCELEMISGGCDKDCHRRRFKTKLIAMGMCGYDRVIVEPSGIFDVDEFFDILHEEPLNRWYQIGNVIAIVDSRLENDLSDEADFILASEVADAGCIVDNVDTVVSVYEAVAEGKPLMQRIVTVTGDGVNTPSNFRAPVGMDFQELLDAAGGLKGTVEKVISGGPMMGFAMFGLDVPTTKTSSSLLCMSQDEVAAAEKLQTACINCGRCVEACPEQLIPSRLAKFSDKGLSEEFEKWHGLECVECGSCSFACPAKRQLAQSIKTMKKQVLAAKRKK